MKTNGRKRIRKRKCHYCHELYRPDPRHLHDQKSCSTPECRKARARTSWRRWFSDPKNRDYFKGDGHVDRTRRWRAEHPGYWKRRRDGPDTLQNATFPQSTGDEEDVVDLTMLALQNATLAKPALVVGLIASLTGSALPNAIAETSRRFVLLGQDILGNGPGSPSKGDCLNADRKTTLVPGACAPGSESLQLDRPPPGSR